MNLFLKPRHMDIHEGYLKKDAVDTECIGWNVVNEIHPQGYVLEISEETVTLSYSTEIGKHYGLQTYSALREEYNDYIPCMVVDDIPDYEVRGLLVDISRDKVPTLATLKNLVDLMSTLRFNQLQLYVEGYSYEYPSFRHLFPGETPVTPAEIQELDQYCRQHFIELVPNQNTLGHMTKWLNLKEFQHLRETDEPLAIMNGSMEPSTLDIMNPESFSFVQKLTDELLPAFTSDKYNAGMDEPFDLGLGRNRSLVEKEGIARIYADYVVKINDTAKASGKHLMIWADMAAKHPEVLDMLPKEITLLEWDYEAGQPVEKHCEILEKAGFSYYVCPGTSAWTTFTGRTDNMEANIEAAAMAGKKHGAKGLLLTDWGDQGHLNYPAVSYAGYCKAAALSWNTKGGCSEKELVDYLNQYIFKDRNNVMGQLVLDAGRYNRLEEFPMFNMTLSCLSVMCGIVPKLYWENIISSLTSGLETATDPETFQMLQEMISVRESFDFQKMRKYLDELMERIGKTKLCCNDADIILDEYRNGLRMVLAGSLLREYIISEGEISETERAGMPDELKNLTDTIIREHERLWKERNKQGGFADSISAFTRIRNMLD